MNNTLSILKNILDDIKNNDHTNNFLLALSMYINFYYEIIVCEEKMMNYLVDSTRIIDKLSVEYPSYTRRQLESTYIAFTIILLFVNNINNINNIRDLD